MESVAVDVMPTPVDFTAFSQALSKFSHQLNHIHGKYTSMPASMPLLTYAILLLIVNKFNVDAINEEKQR